MKGYKPIRISSNSFNFCKFTIAILLWTALIFQLKILLFLCFVILLLSAIFRVEKAPLVFLYRHTIEKIFPSKEIIIDENGVFFAHIIGTIFAGISLFVIVFINSLAGWIIVGVLAVLKTSGAFGRCGAMKLYDCMNNPNGKCCRVGKKIKKNNQS